MRTPVTLKIKFKSANIDQFIERYSVDVSRGGIFIRTKEPLPVGTQLKFEFQLQDSQPLISGEGTVVWIREHDPTRTGVAPGMGVRFDRLLAESQRVLERILSEKQRFGEGIEGRFDITARAGSRQSAGQIEDNSRLQSDRTPLPDPSPFGGETRPGDVLAEFGAHESTRVMHPEQAEQLKRRTLSTLSPMSRPAVVRRPPSPS